MKGCIIIPKYTIEIIPLLQIIASWAFTKNHQTSIKQEMNDSIA